VIDGQRHFFNVDLLQRFNAILRARLDEVSG
jgi:hypothetical protein